MDKPTFGEKFRALLATGRVANLPTVWSNVLVGFWLSSYFVNNYYGDSFGLALRVHLIVIVILITSMIYVGGCMLGDAVDIDFDSKNRPNRPLPKGILSVGFVKLTSYSLLILATFALFCSSLVAVITSVYFQGDIPHHVILDLFSNKETLNAIQLHEMILGCLLVAAVIAYAYNHKKNKRAALVMMASCRFLLVILAIGTAQKTFLAQGYSASDPFKIDFDWLKSWMLVYAASVGIYTILLSWVASTESKPGAFQARNILAGLLLTLPLLSLLFNKLITSPELHYQTPWGEENIELTYINSMFIGSLALFCLWLIYALWRLKSSKPAFVSCALAGFCLLDACIAALMAPGVALICLGLFVLALILQRLTPAT